MYESCDFVLVFKSILVYLVFWISRKFPIWSDLISGDLGFPVICVKTHSIFTLFSSNNGFCGKHNLKYSSIWRKLSFWHILGIYCISLFLNKRWDFTVTLIKRISIQRAMKGLYLYLKTNNQKQQSLLNSKVYKELKKVVNNRTNNPI